MNWASMLQVDAAIDSQSIRSRMRSKLIVVVMALSALSQAGYITSPTVNEYNRASATLGDQALLLIKIALDDSFSGNSKGSA